MKLTLADRGGKLEYEYFKKMPEKCQQMFFEIIFGNICFDVPNNPMAMFDAISLYNEDCKSPIEQILKFALDILIFCNDNCPYDIFPQYEIKIETKKYVSDFALYKNTDSNGEYVDIENAEKILLIECDGHDFHKKTKEQVKHDNEKDMSLKIAGYDVLHFSGSQIYNEPYKCAVEILTYAERYLGA